MQAIAYIVLGKETLYSDDEVYHTQNGPKPNSKGTKHWLPIPKPISPRSLRIQKLFAPLPLVSRPRIQVPALDTGITFC